MQTTEKGLISRVHWTSVKHIKEVPFCISTPPDNWICRSFGRWITKLVVVSTYGERFQTKILCSFFRCRAMLPAVDEMKL
jgi:hypothetical protein